jgi:hypothetical protein
VGLCSERFETSFNGTSSGDFAGVDCEIARQLRSLQRESSALLTASRASKKPVISRLKEILAKAANFLSTFLSTDGSFSEHLRQNENRRFWLFFLA